MPAASVGKVSIPSTVGLTPFPHKLTPFGGATSYVNEIKPGWLATAVGTYPIVSFSDLPGAIAVEVVQPVCAYGYVTTTPVTENVDVPVLVIVSVCGWPVVPIGTLEKVSDDALSEGTAVTTVPFPVMFTAWLPWVAVANVRCPL